MKSIILVITCSLILQSNCVRGGTENNQQSGDRPNILFILADDLGYMDVNSYASYIKGTDASDMYYETPNIDQLTHDGIAFSQAYVCPLCSPTRASILTGKYASRIGFTTATPRTPTYYSHQKDLPQGYHPLDVIDHHDKIDIPSPLVNATSCTAFPAGTSLDKGRDELTIAEILQDYHSAFIGKWHVGGHGAKGYSPHDHGFEEIAFLDAGGSPYLKWRKRWDNRSFSYGSIPQDSLFIGKSGMPTGKKYLTDDLTAQAMRFIDQEKDGEQPFFLYLCHFAVHSPWQGHPDYTEHFKSKPTKGWNGHDNPKYASMIKALDASVGELRVCLKRNGMDNNTIIIFCSDNGGLEQIKHFDITENAPLEGGKACVTEGGIRIPFVIFDPRNNDNGQWCHVPVNCVDLLPTIIEWSSGDPDSLYSRIDGRSLVPLLNDPENKKGQYPLKDMYWHYPFNVQIPNPDDGFPLTPHSAIRQGDYKLIVEWAGNLKLYNIEKDPYEEHNLAAELPKRKEAMLNDLSKWLRQEVESRYFPAVNPEYDSIQDPRQYQYPILLDRIW